MKKGLNAIESIIDLVIIYYDKILNNVEKFNSMSDYEGLVRFYVVREEESYVVFNYDIVEDEADDEISFAYINTYLVKNRDAFLDEIRFQAAEYFLYSESDVRKLKIFDIVTETYYDLKDDKYITDIIEWIEINNRNYIDKITFEYFAKYIESLNKTSRQIVILVDSENTEQEEKLKTFNFLEHPEKYNVLELYDFLNEIKQ